VSGSASLLRASAVCLLALAISPPGSSAFVGSAIAAPHYWPADRLDVRPQIKTQVMPEYPADLPAGVQGRVVLELFIAPDGTLDRVRVARAEPRGRFEQASVQAFSGARFTPGMRNGKAVHCLVRIEVNFN
jgi:TonB family protein